MTTPELSPAVRDEAAQAAYATTAISPYPGWIDLKEEWREQMRHEADAVTAVVAPEIARLLQARVELLTTALRMLVRACHDGQVYTVGGTKLLAHAEKALSADETRD